VQQTYDVNEMLNEQKITIKVYTNLESVVIQRLDGNSFVIEINSDRQWLCPELGRHKGFRAKFINT